MSSDNCVDHFKTLFGFIKQMIILLRAKLVYCERFITVSNMSVVRKLCTNLFYYKFWPIARQISKEKYIPPNIEGYDELKSKEIVENFHRTYKLRDNKLTSSLIAVFYKRFIVTIVFRILLMILYYAYPVYFYPYFINYNKNGADRYVQGILMTLQLAGTSIAITYCSNKNFEIFNILSIEIKTIIIHLMNSKILRDIVDRKNKVKFNNSLITTDLQALTSFITNLNYIWVFIVTLAITIRYLYLMNEYMAIIVLISLIIVLCAFEYLVSTVLGRYDKKHKAIRSQRLSLLKEVIQGIKVVKLYGLHKEAELNQLRNKEICQLKKLEYVETLLYVIQTMAPQILYPLCMLLCFVFISSNPLTIEKVFITLGYLEIINYPTKMCSKLWICRTKLKNSWERIGNFLNDSNTSEPSSSIDYVNESNIAVEFDRVTYRVDNREYSDINFTVPNGSLNVIIGDVGVGKSTFLMAILKLLNIDGDVNVNGKISYVPAEPFLFQDTLEENIVFGERNESFYNKILDKLCLRSDLKDLANGDQTEINERGVNLSGGQKQRICLARSVYQNTSIYLLDNPLSSVDVKVTKDILSNLLDKEHGLLREKTIFYVANSLNILENFNIDNIITIEGNSVVKTPFTEFQKTEIYHELTSPITINRNLAEQLTLEEEHQEINNAHSTTRKSSNGSKIVCETDELLQKNPITTRSKNSLQVAKVYGKFAKLFNIFWICIILILAFVGLALSIESYRALAELGTASDKYASVLKYGFLKSLEIVTMIVIWGIIFVCSLNLSQTLFSKSVPTLFKLPIQYFHKISSGGVSYIYSSDFGKIDTILPKAYRDFIQILFSMLSSIISMWYLSKWTYWTGIGVATSLVIIALYILLIKYNMEISFLLKSAERRKKLLISSYFGDAESGAVIIKANGMVNHFKERLYQKLDAYLKAALMAQIGHRWFACHLEFLGVLISFTTILALVMLNSSSAAFGIALVCTGKIIYHLNQLNLSFTHVNDNMVSFDKITEFVNMPNEEDGTETIDENHIKSPDFKITFDNVNFTYSDRLVLNDISFKLKSTDRLGIVGRTGSGKSTIISSLLRLIDIDSGQIKICDKNIKALKLEFLRNLITLIPQECDIFNGSILKNLDPEGVYLPDEIYKMLEKVNLKDKIMKLKDNLETKITYDSKEISDGEKQLLCLVRGVLRNTKIMIFDETCSKVSLKTERLIQDLLCSERYADSILMVVAHRLQSLEICNKILVLDDGGHIIEFGLKKDLMKNHESYFYKFIQEFKRNNTNSRINM